MTAHAPRRFLVEHRSEFRYGAPAHGSLMLLRLRPRGDGGQRVLDFALDVDPPAAPAAFADPFGNSCHLFNLHRRHRRARVASRARVEIDRRAPADGAAGGGWAALAADADPVRDWEFLKPSRFVRPAPALAAFAAANGIRRGADPFPALRAAAKALYAAFRYAPGATEVDSPIERILETGEGVCQDYTHVLLAIARSWGVPARYVSGYLHAEGAAGEQAAAGASHAWGEFRLPGLGWVGIDPTNDTLADHRHVRVAVGRDYADAAPTRGAVFGGGASSLEVRVTVVEDGAAAPPAAPRPERPDLRVLAPARRPAARPGADQ